MRKTAQKIVQPATETVGTMGGTDTGTTNEVVSIKSGGTRKANLFSQAASTLNAAIADKMAIMGAVRQRLAEAADLYKAGDDKRDEATAIADKAAVNLYQARSKGSISGEEVSAILGDVFGYKPKTDGTPGKTPAGNGEAIRKRVVRAVAADNYVSGNDVDKFFDGLPADEIGAVLNAVSAGDMSIWTAYEKFAEIKREHAVKNEMAFDAKKIAAITDRLSASDAVAIMQGNPALIAAYAGLMEVLTAIGEAPVAPTDDEDLAF